MPLCDTVPGLRNGTFNAGADVLRDLDDLRIEPVRRPTFRLPDRSDDRRQRNAEASLPIRVLP